MIQTRLAALGSAAAATAALAAGAPSAMAADVNAGATCVGGVATGGRFPVGAAGFTPGGLVTVTANGQIVASGQADAAGNFSGVGPIPVFSAGQQVFQLAASDGAISAGPKPVLVTHIGVHVPSRAHATHKVKYKAYGFLPGRRIYLFVRRHGHTLGRFTLGKAKGPCGTATRRLRYMPLRHYSTGTYQYWYSHSRRYSKRTRIYGYAITITRVFR